MVRIAISQAAFDAIARTMPFGSVNFEAGVEANGERYIWLSRAVVDRLRSLRGQGESFSDVILRLRRRRASPRNRADQDCLRRRGSGSAAARANRQRLNGEGTGTAGRQTAVWVDPRDDRRQRLRVAASSLPAYGPAVARLPRTSRERSLSSGSGRAALIRPVNCRFRTGP